MYRLICKDTIEEKILQRAKQKNAVQELVMKGKHVQDDHLMRQEDVVSLLLDDTQIAHKLKEISMQVTLQYTNNNNNIAFFPKQVSFPFFWSLV